MGTIPVRCRNGGETMQSGIAQQRFGQLWPTHLVGLIGFLAQLREAFEGDLDSALIMAIIGSALLPRSRVPESLSFAEFRALKKRDTFGMPLNALSITQSSGIPRETVRRKLAAMERRGWLSRNAQGRWTVTPAGAQALEPMTEYSLEYLNRLSAVILAGCAETAKA